MAVFHGNTELIIVALKRKGETTRYEKWMAWFARDIPKRVEELRKMLEGEGR